MDGLRLVEPHQMHVTLHFIGEADAERVAARLASVQAAVLALTFEGVGQFPSEAGAVVLWAGIRRCSALLDLHTAVATVLAGDGFRPEARAYIPHVTLARSEPGVEPRVVNEFLTRHAAFSLPNVPAEGFRLCSSEFAGASPVYRVERSFQPRPGAGLPRAPT
jgi:2'-5' RNA ligase